MEKPKPIIVAAIAAVAIAIPIGSKAFSSGSSDHSSTALADVRAVCATVNGWDPRAYHSTDNNSQMIFGIDREADQAASEDPQWRSFANDVNAYQPTTDPNVPGLIAYSSAAFGRIISDCTAANASGQ